jgi:hypothetical protein
MSENMEIKLGWYREYTGNDLFVYDLAEDTRTKEAVVICSDRWNKIFVYPLSDFYSCLKDTSIPIFTCLE